MSKINRQGAIYANEALAGYLTEFHNEGKVSYRFQYRPNYLESGAPIGFCFPLQKEAFVFDSFPTFFENLLSEGWIKMYQTSKTQLDKKDEFGLLLHNGKVLIGAISVTNMEKDFIVL
ncbi:MULTISPECIES: HipA N-terminal domain-containing protein [unclassified Alteromonas]|uniref:HipA N-terminal domain-containing protein n=1 Tax=unclassified Alteromonas TaxID=2614992 RepID=UPI00050969FE|nr:MULTISPECIES: HipA N-terminal domain-containing protein [unclassified Alteromonas]